MTKTEELIAKLKELSIYLSRQLKKRYPSFGSNKLDRLKSEIAILDAELAEQKEEVLYPHDKDSNILNWQKPVKNTREFYKYKTNNDLKDNCGVRLTGKELFELMEEFASQFQKPLREELIKFFAWQNYLEIDETVKVVDYYLEYLKQKQ